MFSTHINRFLGLRVNYHGSVFPPYFQEVFIGIYHSFINYSVWNSLIWCKSVFKYCPSRGKALWILLKFWSLTSLASRFFTLLIYSLLKMINNYKWLWLGSNVYKLYSHVLYFCQRDTVESHIKALGLHNFIRGFRWAYKQAGYKIPGGAKKGNKFSVGGGGIIQGFSNMGFYSTKVM